MKRILIKLLLRALNSRWLNNSPCKYDFVGNVDSFSRSNLESEDSQRPGITVREILDEAAAFKLCPVYPNGISVIQDGVYREGTIWDVHELNNIRSGKTGPADAE